MAAWRAVRAAAGEDGPAWAAALADPSWERGGTLLKRDGTTTVWRARVRGREVVVKGWTLRGWARVKSRLRASRVFRHWRGAARLGAHGFRTAACLAIVRGRRDGVPVECLVMEALPGRSLLHHLAGGGLGVREEHSLAREVGRQAARLNAAGCFNRDHKPSNLIVTRAGAAPEIALVDCVAVGGTAPDCVPMLFNLLIEAVGVGLMPRRALRMRVLAGALDGRAAGSASRPGDRRRTTRSWWARVDSMIARHGDARPRVDPLATPG